MTSEVVGEAGDVHLGGQNRPRAGTADRHIAWAAAAIGAGTWLWHAVVVLRSYFYQDDFRYLNDAAHNGLGYVWRDYNGNVMPGQFLLVWLVNRIAPLNHAVAVLPLLLLAAVALVLMWCCLVGVCGRRWWLLVPFTAFALSPALFLPTEWWANSLEVTPLVTVMLAAVRSQIRFIRTGTIGPALAAIGWTVVGLLWWDKAVLIPIVVFGVTVVLAPGTLRPYWRLWLGYVALIGAYAGLYVLATRHDTVAFSSRAHEIPALAGVLVGRTFLPGLLGGPWRSAAGPTSWEVGSPLALAITWAVAAVVVVMALRTGRWTAVWAFAAVAGYLAVDVVLVAVGRGSIGTVIGSDPRYTADAVPVALLFVSAAFGSVRVTASPARFGVLALGVALVAGAVVTIVGPPYADTAVARRYVTTAVAAVRANPDLVLYDGPVPQAVMVSWFGPRARASFVLGPAPVQPQFDQPTDDLKMLDDTGTPRPVVLLGAATGRPGPVANCGYAVRATGVAIPLTTPAHGDRPVVRIGYYTGKGGPGSVDGTHVFFQPGLHYLYLVVTGPPAGVRIAASGDPVCVTDVAVGMPLP